MNLIKIGAAVLNQTPLDWAGNQWRIERALERARQLDVGVLCLPEMCITGYGCEDAFHSPGLQRTAIDVLFELLPHTRGMAVSFGLPLLYRNGLFNTACMVVDGSIAGFVAKRFLAGEGLHYEPRWFNPWPAGRRDDVRIRGTEYPIGDIFFDCGGIRIGMEVCEDAWVAERPGARLAHLGVDIILNPSASHFAFGKLDIRKGFVLEGSRAFGTSYVYANLVGNESGRAIYDGGALIATGGRLVAMGPRFSFAEVDVTAAVVDLDRTRMGQARTHSFRPAFEDDEAVCIEMPFQPASVPPVGDLAQLGAPWERSPHLKEEEFTRAICLALYDYLRKSRSHGFVISLSGGADSSACACLVALMVRLVQGELGRDGLRERLAYIPGLQREATVEEIIATLLLCVYQSTRNSSDVTRNAALAVAQAIGAELMELDVDGLVSDYTAIVADAVGRPLSWDTDDVALQNIQARARGPSVWMLANLRSALLVATSNRSEAAVGYATMDGDTCGGISPIAGIDKAFLRQWLSWLQHTGPEGLSPIPELEAVTVQAPTAELRPPEAEQTDEGDLMPYGLLDRIERAAIRDKMTPAEIYQVLAVSDPQYPSAQLVTWIERFFRLWCRNQWKRERYAPSFHVDDENLDPKTWCRFPILSGGFERELGELRALAGE